MTPIASRRASAAAVLLASLALLAGCSRPAPVAEPLRAVKVMTVGATPLQAQAEFAGEVRARVESRLGFRVAGKLVQRPAQLGQAVKAGQLLAQLDASDLRLAADAARAQVAAAKTQRDLAAADFQRFRALREQNFISGAELERRQSALKAAEAQLQQAQAQLSVQGNQARYANLVADVSGVVTAVEAEPGQVVSAGQTVLRVAHDGPRDVVFAVPEDKVALLRPGGQVAVRPWAGEQAQGRIREVAASADPATRTYAVKVALDAAAQLPLGATVTVAPEALGRGGRQALKVPTTALRQEGAGTAVWVLEPASMTLRSQPVQVATLDGNDAVIVAGLAPGMQVVTAGVHVLAAGQKVSVWRERHAPGPAVATVPARLSGGAAHATSGAATK